MKSALVICADVVFLRSHSPTGEARELLHRYLITAQDQLPEAPGRSRAVATIHRVMAAPLPESPTFEVEHGGMRAAFRKALLALMTLPAHAGHEMQVREM